MAHSPSPRTERAVPFPDEQALGRPRRGSNLCRGQSSSHSPTRGCAPRSDVVISLQPCSYNLHAGQELPSPVSWKFSLFARRIVVFLALCTTDFSLYERSKSVSC